ncbi:MAG: LmeA family phospholipid-binding protein, partial [Actinomycetota bacterium]|nr:LmeA family phospholipid-binding protein [Actinomycetota bacterium]
VIAQLVLPGLAEQRLRDQLGAHGTVLHVEVHAFPAVELLWHQADRVVIRMAGYTGNSGGLGSMLDRAADVGLLDASVATLKAGLLTLRNARLKGSAGRLAGSAEVSEADLRAAVPFLDGVQPVASAGGGLILRGTATLFGVTASVDASVNTAGGQLQLVPNLPFGGLATVTVFSDPRLQIESLSAAPTANGFSVAASARLR